MARDQQRLSSTSSVKDVQALQGELTALAKRRTRSRRHGARGHGTRREPGAVATTTQGELDDRGRASSAAATRDESIAAIDGERTEVLANRETIAAKVPAICWPSTNVNASATASAPRCSAGESRAPSGVALTGSDLPPSGPRPSTTCSSAPTATRSWSAPTSPASETGIAEGAVPLGGSTTRRRHGPPTASRLAFAIGSARRSRRRRVLPARRRGTSVAPQSRAVGHPPGNPRNARA